MLFQTPKALRGWFREPREDLLDLACLGISLDLTHRWLKPGELPWSAILALLGVAAFLPTVRIAPGSLPWRRCLGRLPGQLLLAAGVAPLLFRWLDAPAVALFFSPVWWLLTCGCRFFWPPGTTEFPASWRRVVDRQRLDVALGNALILGTILWASQRLMLPTWPHRWGLLAAVLAWSGWIAPSGSRPAQAAWGKFAAAFGVLALALLMWVGMHAGIARGHVVTLIWAATALAMYRAALETIGRRPDQARAENFRWIVLLLVALWLFHSLVQKQPYGAGDALWYGTMLADMMAQVKAGVFPVFVGQSVFQFNGAIYPLRIAPAFHHLGALVDLLTGRTLGVFAVQNLMLVLCGVGALASAYACLAVLAPAQRWLTCALAILFISCPGVLSVVYNTDLFMSWTTAPFLPLVWFAVVRSFRGGGLGTMLCLGGSLGILWWGHSPIALWTTLLAGASQLVRVAVRWPGRTEIAQAAGGAGLFAAVAAYPLVSVLFFPTEPGLTATDFQVATAGNIVNFLREVFPAVLLPLSPIAATLSDFQLGYGLWFLVGLSAWQFRREHAPEFRVLLIAAVILLVLLNPIHGLDLALWRTVPAFVRNTTGNWVMNRLYLILASLTVFAVISWAGRHLTWSRRLSILLGLACVWSLVEAGRFVSGAHAKQRPAGSEVDILRPENVAITRFAYLVFPKMPDSFNHAPVDPQMENRLLAPNNGSVVTTNLDAALAGGKVVAESTFLWAPDEPNVLRLEHGLRFEPGRRYVLEFTFLDPARARGIVRVSGPTFFREYLLPDYGGLRSFGVGGQHVNALSVWTGSAAPEDIMLRLFPAEDAGSVSALAPFARVRLLEYDEAILPVQIESWIPYRARVRSATAAWLETPRMFQSDYEAKANGAPVATRKSPDGLVAVAVPAGESHVELSYRAPRGLKFAWYFSVTAIAGSVTGASLGGWRAWRRTKPDAPVGATRA